MTKTSGNTGVKRGKIKGWSSSSRRRMREFMLTHKPAAQSMEFCVTLTVPGPLLKDEQVRPLWDNFGHIIRRSGMAAVWRLEVQQRGQVHWHCLVTCPRGEMFLDVEIGLACMRIEQGWKQALDALGDCVHGTPGKVYTCSRWALPEASKRAWVCDHIEGEGNGWVRYMLDHASKCKQEQIASSGRHWGVIGRTSFVRVDGERVELARSEYARVLRAFRKWNRVRIRNNKTVGTGNPWDTHLGFETSRGRRGASVWFGDAAGFARMVAWARGEASLAVPEEKSASRMP